MKTTFSLLFYLKKPKNYVSGPVPIYMRITVDGASKELSTGKHCEPERWCSKSNRLSGTKEDAKTLNSFLDTLVKTIDNAHLDLLKNAKMITAITIRDKFLGIEEKPRYLVETFQEHNDQVKALIGKGFSKGTLIKYNSTLKHVRGFLKYKFKISDMPVVNVDSHFISEFNFYVRSRGNCANNAAVKHVKNLGKVIRICLANRWMACDPFLNHKNTIDKVERVILTNEELQTLFDKVLYVERLRYVRDIFLFCCYTGLSFVDVQELDRCEIGKGVDGNYWILKRRHKTSTPTHIPLLDVAEKIMSRYADHPKCEDTGKVFPVCSNQKMNAYLKEIANLCGITKHLSMHIARHTFATTVTLANGVPIETVSKMLGHTSIKTTQIYAKVLDKKVGEDMAALQSKLHKTEVMKSEQLKPKVRMERKTVRKIADTIRKEVEVASTEAKIIRLWI